MCHKMLRILSVGQISCESIAPMCGHQVPFMYRATFLHNCFEAGVPFFSTPPLVKLKTKAMQAAKKKPAPRWMFMVDVTNVVTTSSCTFEEVGWPLFTKVFQKVFVNPTKFKFKLSKQMRKVEGSGESILFMPSEIIWMLAFWGLDGASLFVLFIPSYRSVFCSDAKKAGDKT